MPPTRFSLDGPLAAYLRGVTAQWLLPAPDANPAMVEIFRDRDRLPHRILVPWAGEFAGKYLTGATEVLRLTGDPALRAHLTAFVRELVSLQADDGYLGPWPADKHLTNWAPNSGMSPDTAGEGTWDTWGHYHIMLGLLTWHGVTGDADALACAARIGDLLCARYLGDVHPRLVETGNTEMNMAPAHGLCLLYDATGDARYPALARQLVDEFAALDADGAPLAGNYLEGALAGLDFYQLPKPRWESLHPVMALAALHRITGEARYREAFTRLWESIARGDRHNNGGFSSGEQATGDPFNTGAIETCCTVAWSALTVEMLHLTGDPRVADELELTLWNSVLGLHSVTGRWATYNTPMDGIREASAHTIVFQSRAGSPELNCCSVNSARGFGLVSAWALTHAPDGLTLNLYAPGTLETTVGDTPVTLRQETDYPLDGHIRLTVTPAAPTAFTLRLRIPRWSPGATVTVNGVPVADVTPGYLALPRTWAPGDVVELALEMSLHGWTGANACAGLTSLYRGPLLLTYDRRFNTLGPDDVPTLDAAALVAVPTAWPGRLPPLLLLACPTSDGQTLYLCDFGSAGEGGTPYRSWLPVDHAEVLGQWWG